MLPDSMSSTARRRLVVIGNGMVGQRLLDTLVAENHHFDITVLCEEPRAAYDRVQLTSFFSGKSAEDCRSCRRFLRPTWHRHPLLADEPLPSIADEARDDVVRTNPSPTTSWCWRRARTRSCRRSRARPHGLLRLSHDRGPARRSRLPPRAARRSASSSAAACSGSKPPRRCKDLGLKTHVVEFAPRLMAVQVDEGGGRVLRQKIDRAGRRDPYRQEHDSDRRWRTGDASHAVRRRH